MTSRKRKRLSPPDEFTKFYDAACKYGWHVYVFRHVDPDDGHAFLQAMMYRGNDEHTAPMVRDVSELAGSVKGLMRELER
jgi:hypothetical protein